MTGTTQPQGKMTHEAPNTPTAILPSRNRGVQVLGVAVLIILIIVTVSIIFNDNFRWAAVGEYLFHVNILTGIANTILLTAISMLAGTVIGTVLAMMKLSTSKSLNAMAEGYVWLFRGIPLLVQLLIWFNLAALYPTIGFNLPGENLDFLVNTNALISPFSAAVIALTLHESALMAEIIRSGILSIGKGQTEAAQALAMQPGQVTKRIILPQAMRVIVPPTGNQLITMLKTTSLVSVIALNDLLYSAQIIYSANYQVIPLLIVATIWYLVMVTVLTIIQAKIEQRFGRGYSSSKKTESKRMRVQLERLSK